MKKPLNLDEDKRNAIIIEVPNSKQVTDLNNQFSTDIALRVMSALEIAYTDYRVGEGDVSKEHVEEKAAALIAEFGPKRGKEVIRKIYAAVDSTISDIVGKAL